MAERILRTADNLEYEYVEYLWGDFVSGGKEVLQRMGIGLGVGFPGEPGCNKRQITTTDPRGFPCTIKLSNGSFPYFVRIIHPGRSWHDPANDWHEAFPGVQRQDFGWTDYFKGSAEALTASGIVPAGYFPGMPGMRSVRVTILADGTLPTGHRNSPNCSGHREEGKRTVKKAGENRYLVEIIVSKDLADRRASARSKHRQAWEVRMKAMPRPPRLDAAIRDELREMAIQKRAQLRVVWSRPKFVPGFNVLPPGPFAR